MKRRAILLASIAGLAAVSTRSFSQASKRLRRIAFVHPGGEAGYGPALQEFRAVLKELGHVEGRDISIEVRWGDDRTAQLPNVAAEVVALKPDVIVTATSAGVVA